MYVAMQTHLFIFALEVLLLLFCLVPDIAFAGDCSWVPTQAEPQSIGYRVFCDAKRDGPVANTSSYHCAGNRLVASFDKGQLVWHSPCGGEGGYAKRPDGSCPAAHFALCLPSSKVHCYWMASGDSCTWPEHFNLSPYDVILFIEG